MWKSSLFLLVSFLLFPVVTEAATVSILPKVIHRTVEPRDILSETIVVKNTGSAPIGIFPLVNNIRVGLDGGFEEFVPPSMSDRATSLTSWLEFSRASIDLMAGEEKEIPLTIRVNPEAKPGVYHAMISYVSGQTQEEGARQVAEGRAPNMMITITIDEPDGDFIELSRFFVERFVTKSHDQNMSFTVVNTGETLLQPRGDVIIYNQRGKEVGSVPMNESGATVKPGESLTLINSVPLDGLFGKYKAFLSLEYGSGRASVYDTVYFYALPMKKIVIGGIVFIVVCVGIFIFLYRRYARDHHEEDDEEIEDEIDAGRIALTVRTGTTGDSHHRDVVMKEYE